MNRLEEVSRRRCSRVLLLLAEIEGKKILPSFLVFLFVFLFVFFLFIFFFSFSFFFFHPQFSIDRIKCSPTQTTSM